MRSAAAILTLFACLVGAPAFALDSPHDLATMTDTQWGPANDGCDQCHTFHHAPHGDALLDSAVANDVCLQCHVDTSPIAARAVVDTHKSVWGTELECRQCHDPHTQNPTWPNGLGPGQFLRTVVNDQPVTLTTNTDLGPGDGTGFCEVCHEPGGVLPGGDTDYHRSDGGGLDHNDGANCLACHEHTSPDADGRGFKGIGGAGDTCITCHKLAKGTRRIVIDDFRGPSPAAPATGWSNHIWRPVTGVPEDDFVKWDCILCHAEGKVDGDPGPLHADGTVNLRNVDSATEYYSYYENDTTGLDNDPVDTSGYATNEDYCKETDDSLVDPRTVLSKFCIGCHDSNGYGDSGFLAQIDAADTTYTRTSQNPFDDGNIRILDVKSQFDPANFITHNLTCWDNSPPALPCSTDCPAGTYNDSTSSASNNCATTESCGGTDPCGSATGAGLFCETRGGSDGPDVCACAMNWTSVDCDSCNTAEGWVWDGAQGECVADFSAVNCPADNGSSCLNGRGTWSCPGGGVSGPEQYTFSDEEGTWDYSASGWTTSAPGGHNASVVHVAELPAQTAVTSTATVSVDIKNDTATTFHVWVAVGGLAGGDGIAYDLQAFIGGSSAGTISQNAGSPAWAYVGSTTASAGVQNIQIDCTTAKQGKKVGDRCHFDGVIITTESISPSYGSGPWAQGTNWDDASLDTIPTGGGSDPTCVCQAPYSGPNCELCDAPYYIEDGDCVDPTAGTSECQLAADCSGGTCVPDHDLSDFTNTDPLCICSARWYDGDLSGDACDTCAPANQPQPPDYIDGRTSYAGDAIVGNLSSPPDPCTLWNDPVGNNGRTGTGNCTSWADNQVTECADCHLPSDGANVQQNAHGSELTRNLLDDWQGLDATMTLADNDNTNTGTCVKCHNRNAFANDSAIQQAYHNHKNTSQINPFAFPCLTCHGGDDTDPSGPSLESAQYPGRPTATLAAGGIHGLGREASGNGVLDASDFAPGPNGTTLADRAYNPRRFLDGAAYDGTAAGSCSTKGTTDSFSLSCANHSTEYNVGYYQ